MNEFSLQAPSRATPRTDGSILRQYATAFDYTTAVSLSEKGALRSSCLFSIPA